MIRFHKHHIVPRHMGGGDEPSNIAYVSIEEHAYLHLALWRQYGLEEDRLAYLGLSGNLTMSEIKWERQRLGAAAGGAKSGLSARRRGQAPWNKGVKGAQRAWNKGIPRTDEVKAKQRAKMTGRKLSPEHRAKLSAARKGRTSWNKGVPRSAELREAHRVAMTGERNPFYGRTHSDESKRKMSEAHRGGV